MEQSCCVIRWGVGTLLIQQISHSSFPSLIATRALRLGLCFSLGFFPSSCLACPVIGTDPEANVCSVTCPHVARKHRSIGGFSKNVKTWMVVSVKSGMWLEIFDLGFFWVGESVCVRIFSSCPWLHWKTWNGFPSQILWILMLLQMWKMSRDCRCSFYSKYWSVVYIK